MRLRALIAGALLLALLGACATTVPAPATLYTFVVLGVDGVPIARVITSAVECPSLELDGGAYAMSVRARPATVPQRPTISLASASKPSAFPVLVCEAAIPAGVARATVAGRVLPLPKANPQRIVVIGDSGCRIKVSDHVFQDCNDVATWPFPRVADTAAASAPDLVIHVGDYNYRENACPAGNAGCAGSPWGYGWDTWEADLFAPAAKLMAAAPWIVVRGNHESCARAGQGWWRFLDPGPLAARQDCNDPANDAIGDYSEPYAVPFGAGGDTQFIVFDSSFVGVAPLAPSTHHVRELPCPIRARVRARHAAAMDILHEPPSRARVRAEAGKSADALSGQRCAAVRASQTLEPDRALPAQRHRRCSRGTCICSRS